MDVEWVKSGFYTVYCERNTIGWVVYGVRLGGWYTVYGWYDFANLCQAVEYLYVRHVPGCSLLLSGDEWG